MEHQLVIGDRVSVVGAPHLPEHSAGTIRQVAGASLGIQFDGQSDIYHWYLPTEVAREGASADPTADVGDMTVTPAPAQTKTVPAWAAVLGVAHVSEYFGPWAVIPDRFAPLAERWNGVDLVAHVKASQESPQARMEDLADYSVQDGVAEIRLIGPLMKQASSLSGGTSTVAARRAIRNASNDTNVTGIALLIDSPGGTVAGTHDLADEVAAARQKKKVYAFIEDLGGSAAYWVASQASKVFANNTALVGSIGTFAVLYDQSAKAAQIGIKVHVIKAGDFKGMGVPGTEVNAAHLAEMQRLVNQLNDSFLQGVAQGRGMPLDRVKQLADGRVHIARTAAGLGLIDAVQSYSETLAQLRANPVVKEPAKKMNIETDMTTTSYEPIAVTGATLKPKAATPQEVREACAGADAAFVLDQIEKSATAEQAMRAWIKVQGELSAKASADAATELEKAKADAAKASATRPGVQPVATAPKTETESTGGDSKQKIETLVAQKVLAGKPRHEAWAAVMREHPELRQALVQETNSGRASARV